MSAVVFLTLELIGKEGFLRMRISDLHMHSTFSEDGEGTVEEICAAAYEKGACAVAFTEHWDALPADHVELPFGDSREYYHLYDAAARQAVIDARERYNGRMKIVYAIEIGQPQVCASVSRSFLDSHDFDFVLGAIHATPEGLDYYFVDYDRMDFDQMFRSYYTRHLDLIRFGNINSIAHMDYPVRKMERWLRKPASMLRYKNEVAEVVRLAAQSGVALEINTNGLRNWFGRLSPEPWVLELYRAFGGTFVTTGSDAHNTDHAAFGIREARELAESLGLKTVSYYERRQPVFD